MVYWGRGCMGVWETIRGAYGGFWLLEVIWVTLFGRSHLVSFGMADRQNTPMIHESLSFSSSYSSLWWQQWAQVSSWEDQTDSAWPCGLGPTSFAVAVITCNCCIATLNQMWPKYLIEMRAIANRLLHNVVNQIWAKYLIKMQALGTICATNCSHRYCF